MNEPAFLPAKAHQHHFHPQGSKSTITTRTTRQDSDWKRGSIRSEYPQRRDHQNSHLSPSHSALPSSNAPKPMLQRKHHLDFQPQHQIQHQKRTTEISTAFNGTQNQNNNGHNTLGSLTRSTSTQQDPSQTSRTRSVSISSTSTTTFLQTAAAAVIANAHQTHFHQLRQQSGLTSPSLSFTASTATSVHATKPSSITDLDHLSRRHRGGDGDQERNDRLHLHHWQDSNGAFQDLRKRDLIDYSTRADPRGQKQQPIHYHDQLQTVPSISPPIHLDPKDIVNDDDDDERVTRQTSMWQQETNDYHQPYNSNSNDHELITPLISKNRFQWSAFQPSADLQSPPQRWSDNSEGAMTASSNYWPKNTRVQLRHDSFVPPNHCPRHPQQQEQLVNNNAVENLEDESYMSEISSKELFHDAQTALHSSSPPLPGFGSHNSSHRQQLSHRDSFPEPIATPTTRRAQEEGDREVLEVYQRRLSHMHSNRTAVADELLVTLDTDTDMEDLILDDSVMGHPSIDVERQTVVEQSILLSTLARLEQEVEQLREANQGLQADLDLFREQTDQQEQDYEQRLQALRVQHEQELTSLQRQETQRVSLLQSTLKTQLTTLRALHQETRQDQLHAEADLATLLLYLQGRRGGHAAEQISLQERASWFSLSPDTVDSMDPPAMMTTTSAVPLAGSKSSLSSTSSDLICVTAMGQSCLRFLQQLDMALSNLSATLSFKEGELPDIGDLVMQHGIVPDSDQNQNQNHLKRRRQQKRRSDCSSVSSGKTIVAQQQQQQQHQQQPRRQLFLPHQHLVSAIAPSVRQLIENHPVQSVSNDIEIRKHIQEKEVLQQRLSEQQIHHQLEVERIKQECIRLYRESLQEVRAELLDKMRQRRRQKRKL